MCSNSLEGAWHDRNYIMKHCFKNNCVSFHLTWKPLEAHMTGRIGCDGLELRAIFSATAIQDGVQHNRTKGRRANAAQSKVTEL